MLKFNYPCQKFLYSDLTIMINKNIRNILKIDNINNTYDVFNLDFVFFDFSNSNSINF